VDFGVQLLCVFDLGRPLSDEVLVLAAPLLDLVLLGLQVLNLLSFPLARVVGGEAIALHPLDATLLFLVLGLSPLPRGQVGLRLWEHLPPGFPLLGRLGL